MTIANGELLSQRLGRCCYGGHPFRQSSGNYSGIFDHWRSTHNAKPITPPPPRRISSAMPVSMTLGVFPSGHIFLTSSDLQ